MSFKKQILIVDIEPFKRGGHFKYWYHLFGETLHKRANVFGILNDDINKDEVNHFKSITKIEDKKDCIPLIEKWLNNYKNDDKIIILMWAYDYMNIFDAIDVLVNANNVKLFSIAAISHAMRNSVHKNAVKDDNFIFEYFLKRANKWKLLIWDQFLNIKLPQQNVLLPLPDVPNTSIEEFKFPDKLINKMALFEKKVGFVGMMFGYRGLSTILEQHTMSKDTLFVCWGPYKENMLPYFQRIKMKKALTGDISNIIVINELLPEGKLTYIISKLDYLFISSKSYPVSSSISIRAACMGKKIITDHSDAAINDMVTRYDCGYIVNNLSAINNLPAVFNKNETQSKEMTEWYSKAALEKVLVDYLELL